MAEVAVEQRQPKPENTVFDQFADEYGPEKVVYIYEPRCGLKGIVVIHNTSVGPAIGGVRMTPNVSSEEVYRLAEAMTWKNALAGIPHGGGKSGIIADSRNLTPERKEILIRQFARGIETLQQYIPGPDMGTDETCMAWVRDEIRRSVGLSSVLGGIPLDQVGATGYGLAICGEVAEEFRKDVKLDGARVSIQGFGNVGQHAARYLEERGAVVTVATDLDGSIHDERGLNVSQLIELMNEEGGVTGYPGATKLRADEYLDVECDIFVPAAQPDVITSENAHRLNCKVILQGANIPCTEAAEQVLYQRQIFNVPDFVANAGGVICASVEYHGGTKKQAFAEIAEKMGDNTREVLFKSEREQILPRMAALALAKERVREAMSYRRAN